MILPDVNVLVYAHRPESVDHALYLGWLEDVRASDEPYGISDLVLSSFMRVVTNPRIYKDPTPPDVALAFAEGLRSPVNAVVISPGARHWEIFASLCRKVSARANLIPDAFLAALAIESGSEWITADRDYSRFPGLRWRHPLEP